MNKTSKRHEGKSFNVIRLIALSWIIFFHQYSSATTQKFHFIRVRIKIHRIVFCSIFITFQRAEFCLNLKQTWRSKARSGWVEFLWIFQKKFIWLTTKRRSRLKIISGHLAATVLLIGHFALGDRKILHCAKNEICVYSP